MTQEQAGRAAELAAFFLRDDKEAEETPGPYGPGVTARVTAAATAALAADKRERTE